MYNIMNNYRIILSFCLIIHNKSYKCYNNWKRFWILKDFTRFWKKPAKTGKNRFLPLSRQKQVFVGKTPTLIRQKLQWYGVLVLTSLNSLVPARGGQGRQTPTLENNRVSALPTLEKSILTVHFANSVPVPLAFSPDQESMADGEISFSFFLV